jgi:Fuc2NAc and GlcNAc transferase
MNLQSVQLLVGVTALIAVAALTGVVRFYALQSNLLDIPNHRSSHVVPTPRGGGLAIVVVFCTGIVVLASLELIPLGKLVAMLPPALLVAFTGFLDDRRGLAPSARLMVHLGAAAAYLALSGGAPVLGISWIDKWPWLSFVLVLLGLVWLLNLFNFMDGIDGIAGVELVYVSFAIATVSWRSGTHGSVLLTGILLGSAGLGFLLWNWPPAKIFMGDVGSGFSGLALGMLALAAVRECGITVWVIAILLGVFITDATLTLLRRALSGEKVYDAHRTHAYQRLSRRWGSHSKVVMASLIVNLFWLLPLGLLAQSFPTISAWIAGIAFVPLVCLIYWARAGCTD